MSEDPTQPTNADSPDVAELERAVAGLSKGAIVQQASPDRSGKQRSHLRGLGHHRKVTCNVGNQGLTPALTEAITALLEQHELIKVKVLEGAPCTLGATALWIHKTTNADVVQLLGRTLLAYRPRKKDPVIKLP